MYFRHFFQINQKNKLTANIFKEQMEPLMLAYPTAGPNFLIGANR